MINIYHSIIATGHTASLIITLINLTVFICQVIYLITIRRDGTTIDKLLKESMRFTQLAKTRNYEMSLIDELYEEIKHGDDDHREWLKARMMDFKKRKMAGEVAFWAKVSITGHAFRNYKTEN